MDMNTSVFVIGVYQDRYLRAADGWQFAERNFNQIHSENRTGEVRGTAFPFPATKVYRVKRLAGKVVIVTGRVGGSGGR